MVSDCGLQWNFGREEDIGQSKACLSVVSSAPAPGSIVFKHWNAFDENGEWHLANPTTTAINYRPAALFKERHLHILCAVP
jgi:hypothetical protein